jgi:hypothetical protein
MRATRRGRAGVGLAAAARARPSPGRGRRDSGDDQWVPAVSLCGAVQAGESG